MIVRGIGGVGSWCAESPVRSGIRRLTLVDSDLVCITNSKMKKAPGDPDLADHEWCSQKAVINGAVDHITAIYGFALAGLVIQSIYNENE